MTLIYFHFTPHCVRNATSFRPPSAAILAAGPGALDAAENVLTVR